MAHDVRKLPSRRPSSMGWVGGALFAAFIGTVVVANWLVQAFGAVPIGFGMAAPAGVFVAGLAFTLRDILQRQAGPSVVLLAIAAGTACSAAVADGRLLLASAVAFATSELLDFAVYTPLRRRGWLSAVLASNALGLVVDSVLFLAIAFGTLQLLSGQVVAKAAVTLAGVAVLAVVQRRVVIA